jgi:AraC-like DNA-binding protein
MLPGGMSAEAPAAAPVGPAAGRSRQRFIFRSAANSPVGRVRAAGLVHATRRLDTKPLRTLQEFALVYLLDGSGRYVDADGTARDVAAGDAILVFPGLPHQYGPVGPDDRWTEFFLMFDGPAFDHWEACGLLDRRRPVRHVEPVAYWHQRLQAVLGAVGQPGAVAPLVDVCRLQLILAEMLQSGRPGQEAAGDTSWVSRACALLERDLGHELDLAAAARELGMRYQAFRKRFRQVVGTPPAKYRSSRIMDRACELMHEGDLTDREIAVQLGFCDEYYFSRRFKQVVGCSPTRFREGLQRAG